VNDELGKIWKKAAMTCPSGVSLSDESKASLSELGSQQTDDS